MILVQLLYLLCSGPSRSSALSQSFVSLCSISHDATYLGLYVDCHNRGLTMIPQDFPASTTSIDLSHNNIKNVTNCSFRSLKTLRLLDLEHNGLTRIEPFAFAHSSDLTLLKLKGNDVCYNGTVFDGLSKLHYLSIDGCYSEEIFKNLLELQGIEIDTRGEMNFTGFHYLQELKYIGIDSPGRFRNETFKELINVRVTKLCIYGDITSLPSGTFSPLVHIKELSIIDTHFGLKKVLRSLNVLVDRNMTSLELNRVSNHGSLDDTEDRILRQNDIECLLHICVKRFILRNNDILQINLTAIANSLLGSCLTHFDMSRNKLQVFNYIWFLSYLPSMSNLKYLDMSEQDKNPNRQYISVCSFNMSVKATKKKISPLQSRVYHVFLPSFLQDVHLSGISTSFGSFRKILFHNGTLVQYFDISYNGITGMDVVEGLDNLKYMNIAGNTEIQLPDIFFDSFPFLETLNFSDGALPQNVLDVQGKRFLKSLSKLTSLHISGNRLVALAPNLFTSNPKLQHLDLSRNIFISIPLELYLNPRLIWLDMSKNSVGTLDSSTRSEVDRHYKLTHNKFWLSLHGNFFVCSCDNFKFIYWLKERYFSDDQMKNLSCLTQTGQVINTGKINKHFIQFWRQCTGAMSLSFSVVGVTLLLCTVLLGLLVATNKTKLTNILINVLWYHSPKPNHKDFNRDAYISYAEADYQWVCHELCPALEQRNLSLYIWDRDSVPGDSIPDQIAENIPQCWKTILYFTDNYERDPWSYMSMIAAINCVDSRNPERLVLLLPEDENPRIPDCLLEVVPESCIIRIPADGKKNDCLWDELNNLIWGRQ